VGIYTPLQFFDADPVTLRKIVFKSVVGEWWYKRLRGFEVDDVETKIGRVGRQYVLERLDLTRTEVLQRLHHLCESVGSRLRSQNKAARGVYVYAKTIDRQYWHSSTLSPLPFFSDQSIYSQAMQLFDRAPDDVKEIGIHCYELTEADGSQLSLFADELIRERQVVEAIDEINKRFGERTIHSADTLNTGIYVKTKIPFGSTRYL
jgi:DNA polymerase-4